jgi:hypothetical protein
MIFVPCACGVIDVGFYVFFFQIVRTLRLFWKWILSFCLLALWVSPHQDCYFSRKLMKEIINAYKCHLGAIFFVVCLSNYSRIRDIYVCLLN